MGRRRRMPCPELGPEPGPCPGEGDDNYNEYYCPCLDLRDYGPNPFVININEASKQNMNYRLALWTGSYLQLTLMSLNPKEDIGLEMHDDVDQFLRVEEGCGLVLMGNRPNNLYFQERVFDDFIIMIPAGTWHNVINTGCTPMKLYSLYAPPNHPWGTVQRTKEDAEEEEHEHEHEYEYHLKLD